MWYSYKKQQAGNVPSHKNLVKHPQTSPNAQNVRVCGCVFSARSTTDENAKLWNPCRGGSHLRNVARASGKNIELMINSRHGPKTLVPLRSLLNMPKIHHLCPKIKTSIGQCNRTHTQAHAYKTKH